MTTQVNLSILWADTGAVTNTGDTKYQLGWIAEIPTFQNFNFVLNTFSSNQRVLAEQSYFDWEVGIDYMAGAKVVEAGVYWQALTDITGGTGPALDILGNSWTTGTSFGTENSNTLERPHGVRIDKVNTGNPTDWYGNCLSLIGEAPMIGFSGNNVAQKNWLLGIVAGEMVVVDTELVALPDNRDISLSDANVYRIYHEGFEPSGSILGSNNTWTGSNTYSSTVNLDGTTNIGGNLRPTADNNQSLGTTGARFASVYCYRVFATVELEVTSDERVKENLKLVEPAKAHEIMEALDVFIYDRIDTLDKDEIGVMAQRAHKLHPSLGKYNEEHDTWTVSYKSVSMMSEQARKYNSNKIAELESQMKAVMDTLNLGE